MRESEELSGSDKGIEAVLQKLIPAPTAIDRDRLMFRAGRRSARRGMRVWKGASVFFAIVFAVSLATRFFLPPATETIYVTVEKPAPRRLDRTSVETALPIPRREHSGARYLKLKKEVLEKGLSALPQPEPSANGSDLEESFREVLGWRYRSRVETEPFTLWKFFGTGEGT